MIFAAACVLCLPSVSAQEPGLSRRDAFLQIWQSIRRPVEATKEKPYVDVLPDTPGYAEIIYAKRRGLLEDTERFSPDAPVTVAEAALWLLNARNVDDPGDVTLETLPDYLDRYPFVSKQSLKGMVQSAEDMNAIINALDVLLDKEEHEVSLYSEKFHGKGTAFGETFDMHAMTAAHRTFPANTLVKVTNVENGKSVVVRINDRGPFVEGRSMDLSLGAFTSIAERSKGVIRATLERLGDASLVGSEGQPVPACEPFSRLFQKRVSRTLRFDRGVPHVLAFGKDITLRSSQEFVIRGATYPDGTKKILQDWVNPGETYSFTPSLRGTYGLTVADKQGRRKAFSFTVRDCTE